MKKLIVIMLLAVGIVGLSACSTKGDKVWILQIGESRSDVAEILKNNGYEFENFSDDSYIAVDEKVRYQGIEWDAVTCWFDKRNRLKSVEFATFGSRPMYQIEKLAKYIKEEGYPDLKEDEKCSGFYTSDKLPMTVMLSGINGGYMGIRLHYCKDADKVEK